MTDPYKRRVYGEWEDRIRAAHQRSEDNAAAAKQEQEKQQDTKEEHMRDLARALFPRGNADDD